MTQKIVVFLVISVTAFIADDKGKSKLGKPNKDSTSSRLKKENTALRERITELEEATAAMDAEKASGQQITTSLFESITKWDGTVLVREDSPNGSFIRLRSSTPKTSLIIEGSMRLEAVEDWVRFDTKLCMSGVVSSIDYTPPTTNAQGKPVDAGSLRVRLNQCKVFRP